MILKIPSWTTRSSLISTSTLQKVARWKSRPNPTLTNRKRCCWRRSPLIRLTLQKLRSESNSTRRSRWPNPKKRSKAPAKRLVLSRSVAMPVGDRESMTMTNRKTRMNQTTSSLRPQRWVMSIPRGRPFQISRIQDSRTTPMFSKTWWSPLTWWQCTQSYLWSSPTIHQKLSPWLRRTIENTT